VARRAPPFSSSSRARKPGPSNFEVDASPTRLHILAVDASLTRLHIPLRRLHGAASPSITLDMSGIGIDVPPPTLNGIRTHAAALMLGVSPNTLRSWERRYGFPRPRRTAGGHRQYELTEIESLRATMAETHNVSSAIALARQRGEGPASGLRLAAAFAAFDEDKANGLLEESLALRSIERTIEEVLLEGVAAHADSGSTNPEYEFGWRFATGWLSALKRLSPPATRPGRVLMLDASAAFDLDALYAPALELMLRRAGVRTLSLSAAITPSRLAHVLPALDPKAVVLTGHGITLDALGRLVYVVRTIARQPVIFDYRGAVPDTGASTVGRLGEAPIAARDLLLARLAEPEAPHQTPRPTRARLAAAALRTAADRGIGN
jgi:MerR family transcriptional regulator, light-induced transcriptional regulator